MDTTSSSSSYLSESVLHDGYQLLPAVGREVQQLGAAVRPSLQSRQDAVGQVQSVGDSWRWETTVTIEDKLRFSNHLSLHERGGNLTDEVEAGIGQEGQLEEGVEDMLGFAVQLVHLVQNQQPGQKQ